LQIFESIKSEFKVLVADLNTLFQDLKHKLICEEAKIAECATSEILKRRMEEHAVNLAVALYTDDFRSMYRRFKELTSSMVEDEAALHRRYFRANFLSFVTGTPFMNRAYSKPLGYAGDYGLMVMFYEYEDIGETLFDKFLHRYACNEPAAVANKNRVELLSEMLSGIYASACGAGAPSFKVSSIACGPAKEIELFIRGLPGHQQVPLETVLLDQDPRAIEYAQRQIRLAVDRQRDVRSTFLTEDAVLGLIRGREFAGYIDNSDVIISAGLFDYLSDRIATKLIGALFKRLKPGGTLLIGNVSDKNPDQFTMDYYMDWHLILRNEETMQAIVPSEVMALAGVQVEVVSEPLGLNLFLKVVKPR
jgi:extracellular factor (EF) 3-hydroxypalmitic acid methyl ester biosynthesis protein